MGSSKASEVVGSEERFQPPPDYVENAMEPLLDISLTDSQELWLIQLPSNQYLDFSGQEVTLKLHNNGKLGEFETSSGKSYEMVSFGSQEPAAVFMSSASESKLVGKISRRVSLLHYPDPSELEKSSSNRPGGMYQGSAGAFSASAVRQRYMSASRGSRQRTASGISHLTMSSLHSSRQRSSLFEGGESSKRPKKKHANDPMNLGDQSTQDSRGKSDVTS